MCPGRMAEVFQMLILTLMESEAGNLFVSYFCQFCLPALEKPTLHIKVNFG
jgi:hypothetical protein